MPSPSFPKSITVTFTGITIADDFGYGDVNQAYTLRKSPHGTPAQAVYPYSGEANGVLVNLEIILLSESKSVAFYDLVKQSDLNTTQHVFSGDSDSDTIPNSITENGGTATIS